MISIKAELLDEWSHSMSNWGVYSASLVYADCHAYSSGAVHRYDIVNFLKWDFLLLATFEYVRFGETQCKKSEKLQLFFLREICKSERRLFIGSRPTLEVLPCFLPFPNIQWSASMWTITKPLKCVETPGFYNSNMMWYQDKEHIVVFWNYPRFLVFWWTWH